MKKRIEKRVIESAKYMVDNKSTLRKTGKEFGISQSTMHHDINTRLEKLDPKLKKKVDKVMATNKVEGKVRGGQAKQLKREMESKKIENVKAIPKIERKIEVIEIEKASEVENVETIKDNQSLRIISTSIITAAATFVLMNRKNKQRKTWLR